MTHKEEKTLELEQLVKELNALGDYQWKVEVTDRDWVKAVIVDSAIPLYTTGKDWNGHIHFGVEYDKLPYIKSSTFSDVMRAFEAPNNMKVLSKKKVTDWLVYYTLLYQECEKRSEERVKRVKEYREEIKQLTNLRINRENESLGTFLVFAEKNGLRYEGEVSEEGYISQRIALNFVSNTVKNFLALANNQYKGKED